MMSGTHDLVYYSESGCTGAPFMDHKGEDFGTVSPSAVDGRTVFVGDLGNVTRAPLRSAYNLIRGECEDVLDEGGLPITAIVYPVTEYTDILPDYTRPFILRNEPCILWDQGPEASRVSMAVAATIVLGLMLIAKKRHGRQIQYVD
jgi:hypothetical protein